jgi:hypothetical protein
MIDTAAREMLSAKMVHLARFERHNKRVPGVRRIGAAAKLQREQTVEAAGGKRTC